MTEAIDSLADLAKRYDAIVFDQWGVLHNGEAPYPRAIGCITHLHTKGVRMAVLSNSGKRAAPNAQRIASMGFDESHFAYVVSSGEALWRDVETGRVRERTFYPIERSPGDALAWADGLGIIIDMDPNVAEAVLLMGLRDGDTLEAWQDTLALCHSRDLPLYCTNPDKASPRGSSYVVSPGVLADAYAEQGGNVRLYGKPHKPIFDSVEAQLGTANLLMVGDSLEHDIAGAAAAGWDSLLIQGGLYAPAFARGRPDEILAELVAKTGAPDPTYRMELLA